MHTKCNVMQVKVRNVEHAFWMRVFVEKQTEQEILLASG